MFDREVAVMKPEPEKAVYDRLHEMDHKMDAMMDLLHSMDENMKRSPKETKDADVDEREEEEVVTVEELEETVHEQLDILEKAIAELPDKLCESLGERFDCLQEEFCLSEGSMYLRIDRIDDQQQLVLEALQKLLDCVEVVSSQHGRPYPCVGGESLELLKPEKIEPSVEGEIEGKVVRRRDQLPATPDGVQVTSSGRKRRQRNRKPPSGGTQ